MPVGPSSTRSSKLNGLTTTTRSKEDAMAVQIPSPEQMREVASRCGLSLSSAGAESFRQLFTGYVEAYNAVAAMPDQGPAGKYRRPPGYRPSPEGNRTQPGV